MSFVIGKGLAVRGELSGHGNVELADQFEGKINLSGMVVVLEGAYIRSDISATEIVVAGSVRGNLMASEKVEFSSTGRLFGNVRSKTLVVREGGRIYGRILTGDLSIPAGELADLVERVRQEEARDLLRSR